MNVCRTTGCERPKAKGRGHSYCDECRAIGSQLRYRLSPKGRAQRLIDNRRTRDSARERRALIDAIKLESGCVDCGFRVHPAALEFDHRDREQKLFAIARHYHSKAWHVVLAEIAKCDVRCANCHRIRSASEGHLGYWARRSAA